MKNGMATLAELSHFDEIIDVRSPAEFADDHIPGAINCPVLDDTQRAEIGTLYVQVSPFEAKKLGAALVSENIARHLKARFLDRPRGWKPLIYCWRGGNRSGAMTTVFRAIGWRACQLEGGYKTYRRDVTASLTSLPGAMRFNVLCGPTGSGKSRILQALRARGEQVLDLEELACHKGSVLGPLPDRPQPGQKRFESLVVAALRGFDPDRPVFVEAESRKIGKLYLVNALLDAIQRGRCIEIQAPMAERVAYLLADYDYFLRRPEWLGERLMALRDLHSRETLQRWLAWISEKRWPELVGSLLVDHYDPLYRRSLSRNYNAAVPPTILKAGCLSASAVAELAAGIASLAIGRESCP